jgi:hypothetical protein
MHLPFLFFYFVIVISNYNCQNKKLTSNCDGMKKIVIKNITQHPGDNGNMYTDTNFFSLYQYKNLVIYKLPYYFVTENDNGATQINIKSWHLIYHVDSTYGMISDTVKKINHNKRVKVDSLLNIWALKSFKLPIDGNTQSLIHSTQNENPDFFEEMYVGKPPYTSDTIFYTFSKNMNAVNYSLSEKINSLKKIKLFKAKIVSYSGPDGPPSITKRRVFELEMIKKDIVEDCMEILPLFEKFKNK